MTTSMLRNLPLLVRNIDAYIERDRGAEYVRHAIGPALIAALADVIPTLIPRHHVDLNQVTEVVHYTTLKSLFSLLYGTTPPRDPSKTTKPEPPATVGRFLRLYDSANFNDPTEGTYLLSRFTDAYDVLMVPAYIASFVTPDKARRNSIADTRNNLVFWRHYGDEGRGCSISIPADRFAPSRSNLQLQKVTYGRTHANRAAKKLRGVVRHLEPLMSDSASPGIRRQVAATILSSLGQLPYLYKSRAYSYEQECRLVALESALTHYGGIQYDFVEPSDRTGRIRMYGQHPCLTLTNILSTGSVITLGPCVPNADNIKYAIEKLLTSAGISGVPIETSDIPYRYA